MPGKYGVSLAVGPLVNIHDLIWKKQPITDVNLKISRSYEPFAETLER